MTSENSVKLKFMHTSLMTTRFRSVHVKDTNSHSQAHHKINEFDTTGLEDQ